MSRANHGNPTYKVRSWFEQYCVEYCALFPSLLSSNDDNTVDSNYL